MAEGTIKIDPDGDLSLGNLVSWSATKKDRSVRLHLGRSALEPMTPARARSLASALVTAADAADDGPFESLTAGQILSI